MSKFMEEALRLAQKGQGMVSPNPLVGAVIVKNGKVMGIGWHEIYGGKHAEANALRNAGKKAKGGALYVTLEPCNHYGKQPPCTKAIIEAGIKEVHYAMEDPNKGSLSGARELKKHGIKTVAGELAERAKKQNEFYITSVCEGVPFVTIKTAMSIDGKITYGNGKRKKISGKKAREFAQELRKTHDAVLVGLNTVLKDDPKLDYRKNPLLNPVRIILDSEAKTPLNGKALNGKAFTVIACTEKAPEKRIKAILQKGAFVLMLPGKNGKVNLEALLRELNAMGIQSVLVEAGNKTASSFLKKRLFNRLVVIAAPKKIGSGMDAFNLKKRVSVKIIEAKTLGKDVLLVLEK